LAEKAFAKPAPIPPAPPVMTTVLPNNFITQLLL
jgi:hypothetical protein